MADLTQEQLAQLYKMYQSQGFSSGANIGGQYLAPIGVQGAGEDNGMNTLQGFTGFDPQMIANQQAQYGRIMPNTSGSIYGVNGGYGGDYKTQDDNPDGIQKAVLAAIIAASAGAASGLTGGAAVPGSSATIGAQGLGVGTGAGSMGAGAGVLGDATAAGYDPFYGDTFTAEPDFGASGELSKASLDGTNSFGANSAGLDTNPGGLYNVGAGAYGGGGIPSVTVNAAAGTPGALTGGGSTSWLDSILSGGKGLLGPAASILGAVAGSQGNNNTSTTNKDIPDWLKPYVTKQLNYAGGLLDQQMSPQYQQASTDIRNQAVQGLLAGPQQNANFARFFPGH